MRDEVAVAIVNFNGGELLARCLAALAAQSYRDFRVIIVDNASSDRSLEAVHEYPDIQVIQLDRNVGFAAGNNIAIGASAGCRWIATLNPDAFPAPDWLERFIAATEANPQYAFFGCYMTAADEEGYMDGTGDVYHVSGFVWRRDHGVAVDRATVSAGEIFAPCAAAALYRADILREAGGFDESYFCYLEDVDLGFRLRLLGYRCGYAPDAVVAHWGSAITGRRSEFSLYYGHRNLVWTYFKNMPAPLFWIYLPQHLLANIAAVVRYSLRGQLRPVLRAKIAALRELPRVLKQRAEIQRRRRVGRGPLQAVMERRFWAPFIGRR